jgi:hypothetical protein
MKKNYFHIVGIALLLSFLALMIAIAPFLNPVKNQIVTTFNQARYVGDVKNFGSSDLETSDTKVIKSFTKCPLNLKIKNSILTESKAAEASSGADVINVNKVGVVDNTIPALQVMCLSLDGVVTTFRDNIVAKWQTEPSIGEQFGTTYEVASKLSIRDFYKMYTEKVSKSCTKLNDYKKVSFLNNDVTSTFLNEYNTCSYDYPTLNQKIDEFYFFPTDDKKPILFVRTVSVDAIKGDFLITKK